MTKSEAIKALSEGKKISHRYFDDHEWIKLATNGSGDIEMENGCKIGQVTFWSDRCNPSFDIDWEIFEEPIS